MTSSFKYHLLLVTASSTVRHFLRLLIFLDGFFDIAVFNGQITGIIGAANTTLSVRGHAEALLTADSPRANSTIFFF